MNAVEMLLCGSVGFVAGYICGKLGRITQLLDGTSSQPTTTSFISNVVKESKTKKKIEIDDTKFVTDISASELKSGSDQMLGTVTKTDDNISSAASKLAQLKRMKG